MMDSFDFYCRIFRYSVSINPRYIEINKWDMDYWNSTTIFRREFKVKSETKKPKITPPPTPPEMYSDDDDFDPIPF